LGSPSAERRAEPYPELVLDHHGRRAREPLDKFGQPIGALVDDCKATPKETLWQKLKKHLWDSETRGSLARLREPYVTVIGESKQARKSQSDRT